MWAWALHSVLVSLRKSIARWYACNHGRASFCKYDSRHGAKCPVLYYLIRTLFLMHTAIHRIGGKPSPDWEASNWHEGRLYFADSISQTLFRRLEFAGKPGAIP